MMFGLPSSLLSNVSCTKDRRENMRVYILRGCINFIHYWYYRTNRIPCSYVNGPVLYVVPHFPDGVVSSSPDILNISIGNTFSGGVIDFTLFGVLQGNDKTNWLLQISIWFKSGVVYTM